jgi:hypothetical protein
MRLLRSFLGLFEAPHVSANPKHRHLGDYLSAATFDDKLAAAERYLGIWTPDLDDRRRRRAMNKATG